MKKGLLIVESPAKIKTIKKYLGDDFDVAASMGHIIDLPKKRIGVDIDNNFSLEYEVIEGKEKVIKDLISRAKNADDIYLGTDPDREGEAISWHIYEELSKKKKNGKTFHRVLFKELTSKGILDAINSPGTLNENLYNAQKTRRVLDRLVGYEISPILWQKVKAGLSAGRVQSVAVRLICERENEIKNFVQEEYWTIEVKLQAKNPPVFISRVIYKNGKKIEIKNEKQSNAILSEIKDKEFAVIKAQKKEKKRNPAPPFITSTLQQEAARKLYFSAKKTMTLAQNLYEGIELGDEGPVGLITYMRTDSTRLSAEAVNDARGFITSRYGEKYLPDKPVVYKGKASAQDAHEAIRPTSINRTPESVRAFLDNDSYKLYDLIWKRFLSCQMNPALYNQTIVDISAGDYGLRSTGSIMKFDGFTVLYTEDKDEERKRADDVEAEGDMTLPVLESGDQLTPLDFIPKQHFTQPPPRYTEASLVKALEEKGIGRPSTYAAIMSNIREREYVLYVEKQFRPTELGFLVTDLLVKNFPNILDVHFTSEMEKELDEIEDGQRKWTELLGSFYESFKMELDKAKIQMESVKAKGIETDLNCEKCQSKMVIRYGKNGEFLACSNYPQCKNTHNFTRDEKGKIIIVEKKPVEKGELSGEKCDLCGSDMVIKKGKYGEFLACSAYPDCKNTRPINGGLPCPEKDCDGILIKRFSKKGRKPFYGCNKYPNCKFVTWDEPVAENCQDCNSPILLKKITKSILKLKCPNPECNFEKNIQSE
jgi:DNA topoisomerase-1